MEGNIIQIIRDYNIDPKNGKFQYKDMETVKKHFLMLLKIAVLSFLQLYLFIYDCVGCLVAVSGGFSCRAQALD